MTEIVLHGSLKHEFKEVYKFENIHKVIDCVSAIDAVSPGFRNFLMRNAQENLHCEFLVNNSEPKTKDELFINQPIERIDICPMITGNDPFLLTFLVTLTMGLIMAGIQYLMTPIPEEEPAEMTMGSANKSFLFASKDNITAQYKPVPLGYGLLRIGTKVIQSTILARDLSKINSSSDPAAGAVAGGGYIPPGSKLPGESWYFA